MNDAYDYSYDGNVGNEEHGRRWEYEEDRDLNNIKTSLPTFKGSSDPEEFLEWKIQIERMFELNNVSDTKMFKHAISKLVGYASSWWEKEK